MKKISNEFKIGATAFVTILAFIWLYGFLKGRDVFNPNAVYYVIYNDIGGLTETNPVEINGYKAGTVQAIDFINDKSGRLLVTISIDKDFILPQKTVAEITTFSLIAGMKIRLVFGDGPGIYEKGDTIPGILSESILTKMENELAPIRDKVSGLISVLDSVLSGLNDVMSPEFRNNVRGTMSNLNSASRTMNDVISSKDEGLKPMIADMNKFSKMLAENSEKLGSSIGNLKTISDSLAAADIYSAISNLKVTLEKTASIMGKMNDGEGTAGQLFTNDSLYMNLNNSVESLDLLLKDLKENPKRYINVSVFGKKSEQKK
jgi:phospholipid/cholesterol/gamma-HCH transport system substrate-binding protein